MTKQILFWKAISLIWTIFASTVGTVMLIISLGCTQNEPDWVTENLSTLEPTQTYPIVGNLAYPSDVIRDFPLTLGNTWIYSSTHYDTIVVSGGGTTSPTLGRITATYLITERVVDTERFGSFFAAKIARNRIVLTSSVDLRDSQYASYLADRTWQPYDWYIISGTTVYMQHELQFDKLNSSLLLYKFPLSDNQEWLPLSELPGIVSYVSNPKDFEGTAGFFEECFQIVTVFLSGPELQWFCNGIGIVQEELDHQGTPFGYKKILIRYEGNFGN